MRVLAWLAFAGAGCVVLFLVFAEYTGRTRVVGALVPVAGEAIVLAPATGVLRKIAVREGARATAGEALGVLTVPRATLEGGDTSRALAEGIDQRRDLIRAQADAERELFGREREGLHRQIENAQRERAQIADEIVVRGKQVEIARDILDRMRGLRESGYASELQIRQQEGVMLDGVVAIKALEREQTRLARSIAEIEQDLTALTPRTSAADADSERQLSELERERIETTGEGEALIVAPVTGVVTSLSVKPGQTVTSGQALLTMLPGNGILEAELFAPSHAVGFIAPDDRVLLRYRAYPYQKFGHHRGRVLRISRSALSAHELGRLPGAVEAGDAYYRIVVRLERQTVRTYGRDERLQSGMVVDAVILGERRRLIEWVFEPLYSLRGSFEDK
jgi:membrane fusion protein